MKRSYPRKLLLAVLFISFLFVPIATGSIPIPDTAPPLSVPNPLVLEPGDASVPADKFAPPPSEYELEIACQTAVYVDEQNPSTNNNGVLQGDYLRVGTGPEFCGRLWALLDIGPITESDGGPLPDDAEVTDVQVKLYKESGPSGTVEVFGLMAGFSESTATWTAKPDRYSSPTESTSVGATNGWKYLDIPIFTFNDAINYHHGVRLALCPTWTDCSQSIAFYSDDHSYRPTLVITYLGEETTPTPPPEPPVDDTIPCELDITWDPPSPSPGQMVTITATATDNEEMRYVAITRGSIELARRDASPGQREVTLSFTEEATLPSLSYQVIADDLSVDALRVIEAVTIPVVGTGTAPVVTVDVEWEIEEVIPERYRLIRGDGQTVTVTATATDPEGIDYLTIALNGILHDFSGDGETSVTETLVWVNDEPSDTTFSYYASAQDREGNYTSTDAEYYDIVRPGNLLLMSTAAPGFHNPSRDRLPWERMVQTFGDGECYWAPNWKSWYALIWYHAGFKDIADNGECFGMSTMACELYQSRIIANEIESSASTAAYMSYDNTFTKEYVEARQGGQLGGEVAFPRYSQRWTSVSEKLGWIEADLADNTPGVIGIHEDDEGHAITPWMSRQMPDGTTRVYVYDSNREGGIISTRDGGTDNPDFDFSNFEHYPYIEFDGSSWSYLWPDGETWNDSLVYFEYEEACGDMDQDNHLDGPFSPTVTDHDIPSVLQYLFCPIGGDVDVYIEDEDGNVTGIYQGEIIEDIPDSVALLPMMAGSFTDHEIYGLPIDQTFDIHISGKGEGEYVFGVLGGGSLFAISDKELSEGAEDVITITPSEDAVGHKVRVRLGQGDDDFLVVVAHMFEGYVAATDSDFIGREYVMEEISATDESDFSVYVEEGGDSLVVENHGDDIEFDVAMRSTESLDNVDTELEELPYIPASTEDDITLGGGQTLEVTPDDWETTEENGRLHTLGGSTRGSSEGTGFPLIPVIIGGVTTAVVLGILAKKGILGKAKKG